MDNSVYIMLSNQLALMRDLEVTSNNIANANTAGYGAEHIQFDSFLSKDVNQGDRNSMSFANPVSTYRDTNVGSLTVTGNDLDVAIEGQGYFQVETPLGTRYTRAGSFQVAPDGTVITADGYPVLDVSGQHIVLPDNTVSVQIGSAGNIKVNGDDFGQFGIVQFDNPQLLERLGSRLYKSDVAPHPADNIRVAQGALESSNVQPVLELTHMINVTRSMDSSVQLIGAIYDLERKAADTWAQQANG